MNKIVYLLLLTLSLTTLISTSVAAEDRIKTGPLHVVDLKHNRLVINDRTRYLAPGYVVKNRKGERRQHSPETESCPKATFPLPRL